MGVIGMEYRRAQCMEDFRQIVDLQNKNLPRVLSDIEMKDGFLSGEFTSEQFQAMNDNLCVMTCFDNDCFCGFLVAGTIGFNKQFSLPKTMIDCFPKISYKGKLISEYNPFISGPGCVDRKYRGKGVFANLVQTVLVFLAQQQNPPDLRISLVSSENLRSINAQKKIGMDIIGQFEFNNKKILIFAMSL